MENWGSCNKKYFSVLITYSHKLAGFDHWSFRSRFQEGQFQINASSQIHRIMGLGFFFLLSLCCIYQGKVYFHPGVQSYSHFKSARISSNPCGSDPTVQTAHRTV